MYTKKTKIVATIGPATESSEMLEKLFKQGVNVIRLNFSHGDFKEHGNRITRTREVSNKVDMPIAVLQDLAGPKIRIGEFYQERVNLSEGQQIILTTEKIIGDETRVFINYDRLPKEVKAGQIIFLDDGKKKLIVESVSKSEIYCKILIGGECKGRRGVNVPGAYLSISSLTEKDKSDLEFGIENEVDYIALSFVRRADDVRELRNILKQKNAENILIISKIETQEAIDNIDEILEVSDGLMVARGDLAIEIPAEQVPFWQKTIIKKANKVGKPVITATQMLESMINSPVPTRAEVSDVANAIFDGTDAVMLSEETTLGRYPLQAVEVMYRVAVHTEKIRDASHFLTKEHLCSKDIQDSLAYAAINMAHEINANALVAYTTTGRTPRFLSRYRPKNPLFILTSNRKVYNQLALDYGCYSIFVQSKIESLQDFGCQAKELLLLKKKVKKGEQIILVTGLPMDRIDGANMIFVEKI